MLGRLKELRTNPDGTQNITVTIEDDFREAFDELSEKDVDITIKKYSKKRSQEASNLCWSLIDRLAEKQKLTKTEVYRSAIREIGGVSDVVCVRNDAVNKLVQSWTSKGLGWQAETEPSKFDGYMRVTLYYGSSVFSQKQMSDLIDSLIQDCNALGIPTMSQKEIDNALKYWVNKENKNEQVNSPA